MRALISLMLVFASASLLAQVINVDKVRFGRISDEELSMTVYEPEPDAKAVVLFDEGKLRFDLKPGQNTFQCVIERHLRIKILDAAAVDQGNFSFLLEHSSSSSAEELIDRVRGSTYNLVDGDEVESKLTNEGIFEEEVTDNLRSFKIVFPQVRAGSVIELKYNFQSDFIFNLPTWYFQQDIPVDYSYFEAEIPEYYLYNLDMQGYAGDRLVVNEFGGRGSGSANIRTSSGPRNGSGNVQRGMERIDYSTRQYKWAASEVPSLPAESFAPHPSNFYFRVNFELSSVNFPGQQSTNYTRSWEDVCDTYLGASQRPYLNGRGGIKDLAESWIEGIDGELDRVVTIYERSKRDLVWDGNRRIFPVQTPSALLNSKAGSSAELNFFLIGALRAAGISADPVLMSTRNHGYLSLTRPSLAQFNHVIVQVNLTEGGSFLLDASKDDIPVPLLPLADLNDRGRVIHDNENSTWVDLTAPSSAKSATQLQLSLTNDGNLSGSGQFKYEGYAAIDLRRSAEEEGQVADYLSGDLGANLTATSVEHFNDIYEDVVVSAEVEFDEAVLPNGELMYVQPILIKPFDENPFEAEERILPIDMVVPQEHIYVLQLSLTEGQSIEEIPEPISIALPESKGRYSLRFMENNEGLQVVERLKFSSTLFSAEEYQALRGFMAMILESQDTFVVIRVE